MRVAQVSKKSGDFEIVHREIPKPSKNEVLIKVEACGICHSDSMTKDVVFPDITLPRVPGHEVIGRIVKLGEAVKGWSEGQRVGVGWHGGHCYTCSSCRKGDYVTCANELMTGVSHDGGYAEYMIARADVLALVPEGISPEQAAPLMCAGLTVFNSIRNSGAIPGDLVVILGIGGLGHLAIQYAAKSGFKTVAVSTSASKKDLALQLGAHIYIDSSIQNIVEELQKLGGAKVVIATAPHADFISSVIDGIAVNGKLVVLAADTNPLKIAPLQLIPRRISIAGWPSGNAKDSEETLNFSVLTKVLPMVETYPFEDVNKAYQHMISNQARFRAVLVFKS